MRRTAGRAREPTRRSTASPTSVGVDASGLADAFTLQLLSITAAAASGSASKRRRKQLRSAGLRLHGHRDDRGVLDHGRGVGGGRLRRRPQRTEARGRTARTGKRGRARWAGPAGDRTATPAVWAAPPLVGLSPATWGGPDPASGRGRRRRWCPRKVYGHLGFVRVERLVSGAPGEPRRTRGRRSRWRDARHLRRARERPPAVWQPWLRTGCRRRRRRRRRRWRRLEDRRCVSGLESTATT